MLKNLLSKLQLLFKGTKPIVEEIVPATIEEPKVIEPAKKKAGRPKASVEKKSVAKKTTAKKIN